MKLVDQFAELFQGNRAAVGTEDGGCWRIGNGNWEAALRQHLTGEDEPIGVYPMVLRDLTHPYPSGNGEWMVHWGCVDFDLGDEESWVHAKNLHRMLQAFSITAWMERSRSKGYHVWAFMSEWVPAVAMREALLGACQTVGAPTTEINPKQTELRPDQLGNYVRLPYPGHLGGAWVNEEGPIRRVMVDPDGHWFDLGRFVDRAYAHRSDGAPLVPLRRLYTPPPVPLVTRDWAGMQLEGDAVERLRGKARIIYEDGPIGGAFRGHTLWKLACYLHEDGRHTSEEALELLRDADLRWGKFHSRPDRETRLLEMVDKAWAKPL